MHHGQPQPSTVAGGLELGLQWCVRLLNHIDTCWVRRHHSEYHVLSEVTRILVTTAANQVAEGWQSLRPPASQMRSAEVASGR